MPSLPHFNVARNWLVRYSADADGVLDGCADGIGELDAHRLRGRASSASR